MRKDWIRYFFCKLPWISRVDTEIPNSISRSSSLQNRWHEEGIRRIWDESQLLRLRPSRNVDESHWKQQHHYWCTRSLAMDWWANCYLIIVLLLITNCDAWFYASILQHSLCQSGIIKLSITARIIWIAYFQRLNFTTNLNPTFSIKRKYP